MDAQESGIPVAALPVAEALNVDDAGVKRTPTGGGGVELAASHIGGVILYPAMLCLSTSFVAAVVVCPLQ